MNNLEIDRHGTIWLALFYQSGLAKSIRRRAVPDLETPQGVRI